MKSWNRLRSFSSHHLGRIVSILGVIGAVFLSGCASSAPGPLFAESQGSAGKALVYFYRPSAFAMRDRTVFLSIPLASNTAYPMVNEGYYPYIAEPGDLVVAGVGADLKPVTYSMKVEPGQTRYVKVGFAGGFAILPPATFEEVSEPAAKQEIASCHRIAESAR